MEDEHRASASQCVTAVAGLLCAPSHRFQDRSHMVDDTALGCDSNGGEVSAQHRIQPVAFSQWMFVVVTTSVELLLQLRKLRGGVKDSTDKANRMAYQWPNLGVVKQSPHSIPLVWQNCREQITWFHSLNVCVSLFKTNWSWGGRWGSLILAVLETSSEKIGE